MHDYRFAFVAAALLLLAFAVVGVEYGSDAIVFTANDSTLTMTGDGTVWDDIPLVAQNLTVGVANDPVKQVVVGNVRAWLFDDLNDYLEFELQASHRIKEDSSFSFHVHTGGDGTDGDGGNIRWSIECSFADINDSFSSSATLTSADLAISGTDEHLYHEVGDFTNATHGVNDNVSCIGICRITRVAATSDDYTGGAWLWSVDPHIEIDKLGSRSEDAW